MKVSGHINLNHSYKESSIHEIIKISGHVELNYIHNGCQMHDIHVGIKVIDRVDNHDKLELPIGGVDLECVMA